MREKVLPLLELVNFDPGREVDRIAEFIEKENKQQGYFGGIVGLSGGIDSSVCAALMTWALGTDKVIGISMTERDSRPEDYEDAKLLADYLNIEFINHPITKHLESLGFYDFTRGINFKNLHKEMIEQDETYVETPVVEYYACLKLRTRAWILAHYAKLNHYFQCQTLNRSEHLLGYHDLFGDGIGDIALIQHLYKSEVYELGRYLKLPEKILRRPSMSGNYNQDTDLLFSNNEFLRMSMLDADTILYFLERMDNTTAISRITGFTEEKVCHIKGIVDWAKGRWAIPATLGRETYNIGEKK